MTFNMPFQVFVTNYFAFNLYSNFRIGYYLRWSLLFVWSISRRVCAWSLRCWHNYQWLVYSDLIGGFRKATLMYLCLHLLLVA